MFNTSAMKLGCLALVLGLTGCDSTVRHPANVSLFHGKTLGPVFCHLEYYEGSTLLEKTFGLGTNRGEALINVGRREPSTIFLEVDVGMAHFEAPFRISSEPCLWREPVLGDERGDFLLYAHEEESVVLCVRDSTW